MDTVGKLALIGSHMRLEPAEDADAVARPTGWADPHAVAPCGHSPADLRRAVDAGALNTLTKGAPDPGAALEPASRDAAHRADERHGHLLHWRPRGGAV